MIGLAFLCLRLFEWKLPKIVIAEFIIFGVFGTQAFVPLLKITKEL